VNLGIPTKEVTITGTPKIYADKDSASGNTVNRHFCSDCGTYVLSLALYAAWLFLHCVEDQGELIE